MIILKSSVNLYSTKEGEIENFLTSFYNEKVLLNNNLKHNIFFENPVEMIDLISTFIENNEKYQINMWKCLIKKVVL